MDTQVVELKETPSKDLRVDIKDLQRELDVTRKYLALLREDLQNHNDPPATLREFD